jgi:anaerobic magnesium-protoporphyrin IX monomethyl ester cyclase
MNIIFVDRSHPWDRLGTYILCNVLQKNKHDVRIIFEDKINLDEYFKLNNVDFVCFSIMSTEYPWFRNLIAKYKHYGFKTIVGGPHFTFNPEDGETDPLIDYVVIGPGELVINDVVKGKTNKVIKGILPPISSLANIDRTIPYQYPELRTSQMKRFMSSRGCPYNCSYCHNRKIHDLYKDQLGVLLDRLTPKEVVDDIVNVKNMYGLELAFVQDDDMVINKEWTLEFCSRMQKNNIKYIVQCRFDRLDEDLIKIFSTSGCQLVIMALETMSEEYRKTILHRGVYSNEFIRFILGLCNKWNVRTRILNMIGLPVDDSLDEAIRTLRFNLELNPTATSATILQPLPGTEINNYCIKKYKQKFNQCMTFREETVLPINDFEKINRLIKWWDIFFRKNMPEDWIRTILEIPIPSSTALDMHKLTMNSIYSDFFGYTKDEGNCDYIIGSKRDVI